MRIAKGTALAILLMVFLTGTVYAQYHLDITGFWAGGGKADVIVRTGFDTVYIDKYEVGGFTGSINGTALANPLYCLDIFHSFSWGDSWDVTPFPIPPDPPNPPPFNTGECAWLYMHYGSTTVDYQAQGLQLALWEVSHDQNWRTNYDPNTWHATGNFQANEDPFDPKWSYASTILDDLYWNYSQVPDGSAAYYRPDPYNDGVYFHAQGQIGHRDDMPHAPEPGSMLILGLGLLSVSVAGRVYRRRRKG